MNRPDFRTMDFIDRQVVNLIVNKYGYEEKTALREFIQSDTYNMLLDKETGIYMLSHLIIFDMWEAEKITGDPRKSQYIRV